MSTETDDTVHLAIQNKVKIKHFAVNTNNVDSPFVNPKNRRSVSQLLQVNLFFSFWPVHKHVHIYTSLMAVHSINYEEVSYGKNGHIRKLNP